MRNGGFWQWLLNGDEYGPEKVVGDDAHFEQEHPRASKGSANSRGGKFTTKPQTDIARDANDPKHAPGEDEGIKSYTTKAVKKNGKWVEVKEDDKGKSTRNDHSNFGKKKKNEKWLHLPPPAETKPTPTLDLFRDVPPIDSDTIRGIKPEMLYMRGDKKQPDGQDSKEGVPQYSWLQGARVLSDEEAYKLEKALYEGGHTQALFDGNTDVKVRPDLAHKTGQIAVWTGRDGNGHASYGEDAEAQNLLSKAKRVGRLYEVYDQIKDKIIEGVHQDDPRAWMAYFMMRTKVRLGTKKDTSEGRGVKHLTKGDISLSNDGETFYLAFNSKGRQFWHTTAKDRNLYDYLKKKKESLTGAGANTKPIFDVGIEEFRNYLKEISTPLTGDSEIYMMPHDFRRLGATRIADEYLREELKNVNSASNRNKWEDRICKAVQKAAANINDTPKVAFEHYILPRILLDSSPEDLKRYFPCLAEDA